MLRALLPGSLRRFGALKRRDLRDWWRGRLGSWAAAAAPGREGELKQIASFVCPILNPAFQRHVYDNKMHNLALVQSRLEGVTLRPRELFSFWRLVGQPDEAHGFKVASNFIDGRVAFAEGGGICQLTSALYDAAFYAPESAFCSVRLVVEPLSADGLHTRTRRERDGRSELVSEDRYALPPT